MSPYLGFDVLDVGHDRREPVEDLPFRRHEVLDADTGPRSGFTFTEAPAPARSFLWTCSDLGEAAALRAFVAARRGRAVPFWVISHDRDLTLATDLLSGQDTPSVVWVGYARHLFPYGGARRHVALYRPGLAPVLREVTGATDPGTGLTESLVLDSAVGSDFPAANSIVSFLRFCRLEEDDVELEWLSRGVAQARLRFRDLPLEVPA